MWKSSGSGVASRSACVESDSSSFSFSAGEISVPLAELMGAVAGGFMSRNGGYGSVGLGGGGSLVGSCSWSAMVEEDTQCSIIIPCSYGAK